MAVLEDFFGQLFKPAADFVDSIHTSEEEKAEIEAKKEQIKNEMRSKLLEYESQLMNAQSSVIMSESAGQSMLQRNWRPITMLTFLFLVICDSFGLLKFRLSHEAWELLKMGVVGYMGLRSTEKLIPEAINKLKK